MKIGRVWLVGAGPGNPGLLTLRGKEVLDDADCVVFDRLVGDGVLSYIPPSAEMIDVGKEGGNHPVPQSEIENIIVREALLGKKVVRLKGGDSFVFGRGGEEIEALIANNIPYEVVPGITSAIAAPSAAGIPVTHRGLAASLHIITAHTKDGGIAATDYEALAKLGGTLLFLMGASSVREICRALMANGMSPDTPAAAVENGTTASQRRIAAPLSEFEKKCEEEKLHSPAIIMVGECTSLGEKFDFKKYFPLSGYKIVVTRPRARAGRLSKMLRAEGAEVVEIPCISTSLIEQELPNIDGYRWIGFTSAAGVESFFELLAKNKRDVRTIGNAKIAAIGSVTAEALRSRGLTADFVPDIYDGENMAVGLAQLAGREKILMLRAEDGSPELTEQLKSRGCDFTEISLYRTEYEKPRFVPKDINCIVFTSASTVRGFVGAFDGFKTAKVCCIGRQTAKAAREAGFKNIKTAEKAELKYLIKSVEED